MGKFKNLAIGAASIALSILTCTETHVGNFMRKAAFASAGIYEKPENPDETHKPSTDSEITIDRAASNLRCSRLADEAMARDSNQSQSDVHTSSKKNQPLDL